MGTIFEGKGKSAREALISMFDTLTESETLMMTQVADGDYVVGLFAEKLDWDKFHEWECDRKMYYRKQIEDCTDLKWEDIKKGRHFYCVRDFPGKAFVAGRTYYCGCDSVIANDFGRGELFNPIDVPFHFRLATQDEIEQYYTERRKRLDELEERRKRMLEDDYDDDDDDW